MKSLNHRIPPIALAALLGLVIAGSMLWPDATTTSIIVQGEDLESAARAVREVGGEITHELGIIDAVGARLTARQLARLQQSSAQLGIFVDHDVDVAGGAKPDSEYPALVGVELLHQEGIDGFGVTVALIDTGVLYSYNDIKNDPHGDNRILAEYDAIKGKEAHAKDQSGHGTHVASVIASVKEADSGKLQGVAPNVNLVSVNAFERDGVGSYASVIRGIDYVVQNKDKYGIRVLNLSFSAPPRSHYWDDPLNQAVMRAWQAGIVVVASAGNTGPEPMTIGVPGNVPYVITVGAMTDSYTPDDLSDERLATFSSAGPTVEGFVKPEIVAPGGHMLGIMDDGYHDIADEHPEFASTNDRLYTMSGTSQSAGVVTLMLQAQPYLTPDDVKCKLMGTARAAMRDDGQPAYTIFQQGAGLVNAYGAVHATDLTCANRGLDIDADLAGTAHFSGRANRDEDGNYYLMGLEGDGFIWSDSFIWSDRFIWSDGHTESASVNTWVDQE